MYYFNREMPDEEAVRIEAESPEYKRGYADGYSRAENRIYADAGEVILFQDSIIHGLERRLHSLQQAEQTGQEGNRAD